MWRNIKGKLAEWKNNPRRKPLLVRGARQVGKTWSIKEFGNEYFIGNVHYINFEKSPENNVIFNQNLDITRIISELELLLNKEFIPGKDLLFFDEIQECPNAIMSLRYFYEEKPELHVIAAGSLLEFALKDISFPVGRIQIMYMNPLNFEEFLIASGKEILAQKIRKPNERLSETVLKVANEELRKYYIVGGMPECVDTFVKTNSFIETIKIQSDLILTFRQDFSKYAGHSDKRCLNAVLSSVSRKVGEQIKYSRLAEDFSIPTIKKAFELLETARLFSSVPSALPEGVPLGSTASGKRFKAVFLDIGLLSNLSGYFTSRLISKQKMFDGFNGKMAEQFVGQELRASGIESLFYWSREKRGSSAEVDYLIEKEGEILPVEVKSGKAGKLKSLHLLLEAYINVNNSYVFTEDKYGEIPDQRIRFLPIIYAGSISNNLS